MSLRILWCGVLLISAVASTHAQFDFGKIKEAIKSSDTTGKAAEADGYLDDGSKVAKGVMGISLEEEKSIGESVAMAVISKYGGLVRDEAITKRVNLVGRSLALYSSRPDLEWTFAVLNSDSVNAFSAPGGYVFITKGLYQALTSDDALAGVLGHEIAHITGKHALNIMSRAEVMAGAVSFFKKRSSDVRQVDSVAGQLNLNVEKIVNALLEKGFDPNTEYAADKSGRDLTLTTGYAPGALRATLAMLQARGGAPKAMFSTHPPFAERIKRLPNDPAPVATATPAAAASATPAKPTATEASTDDEAFFNAANKNKKSGSQN